MSCLAITYVFRSPGTGHSIDELFGSIEHEMRQKSGMSTRIVRLPHISRGVRSLWQNLQVVRKLRADVFHVTGDVHYAALALPASHTVLTIHDCFLLQKNRRNPLRYALFWLVWYYLPIRRAALVTAVSEKTRLELIRYLGRTAHKVQVVPNGYAPCFTHQPRAVCTTPPSLLQIGTAPHKNLFRLMAAIDGIPCTLVIVGTLTETIRRDLHLRKIAYRHYVNISRADMVTRYGEADIVTFVSTYEGFGMPIPEANATGRAVLTSNQSPMREVAGEAACFVDPNDVTSIRNGILRLIQDDTYRQKLIDAGLNNARQYTVARTAALYANLYQQLAPSYPLMQPVL
ncbi:glycosyltransferase family 4 protein [Spirosoma areae]